MNYIFRTYPMYNMLFFFLLVFLQTCCATIGEELKYTAMTKRDLLSKELEYFKSKPLSKEMRSFIKRFKRKIESKKQKRQKDVDKDNMYVVQNGEIIPLSSVEKNLDEEEKPLRENYTVIPLIIPISLPKDNPNVSSTEATLFRNNRAHKINPFDECETTKAERIDKDKVDKAEPTESIENETADQKIEGSKKNGTGKSVDPKLVNKILQDVEQLAKGGNDTKVISESPLCKVEGDWDSIAGGMEFRIEVKNDSHRPDVRMVNREPPMEEGFLRGQNWSVTASVPFSRASILVLNAYTLKGKKIAALFTGECRVCDGEESIVGNWLIQRHSKDCKDRAVAHKFISDVFKKNNVRRLQQDHLHAIETSTDSST